MKTDVLAAEGLCYSAGMKILLMAAAIVLSPAVVARDETWTLGADTWAQPRDGRAVASMAPLPEAVNAWSRNTERRLLIHYPGGEDGQLWAYELRSWLVALGVPLDRLELVAGSQQTDLIELELSR
jgi:hypothetical protein